MDVFHSLALGLALLQGNHSYNLHTPESKYFVLHAGGGRTIVNFLGDTDLRRTYILGLQFAKPEPHLRFARKRAHLVEEVYYQRASSKGPIPYNPANKVDALGVLALARYEWVIGGTHLYGDAGIGLQYSSQRTYDLPSRLSSTPTFDLGVFIPAGKQELTLGLRFMHISNAGTQGSNGGQNQLFLDLGVRF